jgi:hypothetical protein
MRRTLILTLMAVASLSACASKPRPEKTTIAATCPPLTPAQWGPPLHAAMQRAFDSELQRRFGATGTHTRIDQVPGERGALIVTARRIGPAAFEMPTVGKGGEVMVILAPCTAKVLKVRKLAVLEAHPLTRAANEESGT